MSKNKLLKLHSLQRIVQKDKHRFRVVVAGRRWGKSVLSKILLITEAVAKPNRIVYYVMPTYNQARSVMWNQLRAAIPREWVFKTHETRMEIWLHNGSLIALKGADKPDTLRGMGLDFIVLDEVQDMKEEVWEEVLRPTLSTTGGKAIFICTPKSYNWVYDKFMLGQRGEHYRDHRGRIVKNEWKSWQFPTVSSPFVAPAEVFQAKQDLDPRTFEQEYLASFTSMSGRVYYPFDRKIHTGDYEFNPLLSIYIGMDFNIDPMSAVIVQEQPNGEIWIVDEIVMPSSNTEETAQEIMKRYYRYSNRISIFPDPAGNNRNQGRGETNLEILRENGLNKIFYHRKHPAVADRINAVNRLLMTAEGEVRLFINSRCRRVIDSFEQTVYKEGSSEVNKSLWTEHPTDAFGYYAEYKFPTRKSRMMGTNL